MAEGTYNLEVNVLGTSDRKEARSPTLRRYGSNSKLSKRARSPSPRKSLKDRKNEKDMTKLKQNVYDFAQFMSC